MAVHFARWRKGNEKYGLFSCKTNIKFYHFSNRNTRFSFENLQKNHAALLCTVKMHLQRAYIEVHRKRNAGKKRETPEDMFCEEMKK